MSDIIQIASEHGIQTQVRAGQLLLADVVYHIDTNQTVQTWVNATTWTTGKLLVWLGY